MKLLSSKSKQNKPAFLHAILAARPNHSAIDNNKQQSALAAAAAAYSSSFSLTLSLLNSHTHLQIFRLFYPRWAAAAAAAFRGSHKSNPKTATCFSPPLVRKPRVISRCRCHPGGEHTLLPMNRCIVDNPASCCSDQIFTTLRSGLTLNDINALSCSGTLTTHQSCWKR